MFNYDIVTCLFNIVSVYMRVALFKIRLLRKSVSNIRGPIAVTSQNIGFAAPSLYAPVIIYGSECK